MVAVDGLDYHGPWDVSHDCVSDPFLVFVGTLSMADVADSSFQRE